MLTVTLSPNRTSPRRFVTVLTYERQNNYLTPVKRVFDGPGHCVSTQIMPWPRKDWSNTPNGEYGAYGKPFTIKRDWLALHNALAMERAK